VRPILGRVVESAERSSGKLNLVGLHAPTSKQCQKDLATLEVELRLREQEEFAPLRQRGVVASTKDGLVRVGEDISELKRLIDEYVRTLAK
jgi:hypothetical protein